MNRKRGKRTRERAGKDKRENERRQERGLDRTRERIRKDKREG